MTQDTSSEPPKDGKPPHPIAVAVDQFIHRVRDTKLAARQHMPIAGEILKDEHEKLLATFEKVLPRITSGDRAISVVARKEAVRAMARSARLRSSDVPWVIEVGLFLTLFAWFDAFVGDLLRALYERKPALFGSLSRAIDFTEILAAPSLEHVKRQVLEDDIETFRRKSYVEQFASLAARFDVKLTGFSSWSAFVECAQRRNLLTHCDGIVSDQYHAVCTAAGAATDQLEPIGSRVKIGATYFYRACEVVLEVGLKLAHTLWRKTLPSELNEADDHLRDTLYNALEQGVWYRARMIGEFALGQPRFSSERNKRTMLINYVQALKRDDAGDEAAKVLGSIDWTAASHEFRLADLVLRERYADAADLMIQIGSSDPLLTISNYHLWPLFLEFRETEDFARAYRAVFGHEYVVKLEEKVTETAADTTQQIEVETQRAEEAKAAAADERAGADTATAKDIDPAVGETQ